ncbi:MAG: hypothetical protein DSM106950_01305 [Stigonema ocellatum SAG 48.90 = DSM 106950]|nr:hypothetical protein [Stigonema ocellatum SAG 48.90 = DSM 106950]
MSQLSLSFNENENDFSGISKNSALEHIDISFEIEYINASKLERVEILRVDICLDSLAKISPSQFLPTWCNPRALDKRSAAYKSMVKTLIEEPEKFGDISEAITIYADFVSLQESQTAGRSFLTLRFEAPNKYHCGQGIARGLHRASAAREARLQGANLTNARLKADIWLGMRPEMKDLENILLAQQTHPLDKATIYNFQRKFQQLKEATPKHWKIKYYQGQLGVSDSKRCTINHQIQLLNMLDIEKFNPEIHFLVNAHPINNATSIKTYNAALDRANKLRHFIIDVVHLEHLLLLYIKQQCQAENKRYGGAIMAPRKGWEHCFTSKTSLPDGSVIQVKVNTNILFPIISSLRAAVDPITLQWKLPFMDLVGTISEGKVDNDKIIPAKAKESKLIQLLWDKASVAYEDMTYRNAKYPFTVLLKSVEYWQDLYTVTKKYLG